MKIEIPSIDDRTYRQILSEAVSRIRVHNPEWTNHSDADPGITVLQLFASMTESLLYRSNKIPERNRKKFLNLLGVELLGAVAARGIVSFQSPRGRPAAITVAPGIELLAGGRTFSTELGVDVLPVEAQIYLKGKLDPNVDTAALQTLYSQLYLDAVAAGETLLFYQTRLREHPRPGEAEVALDLGADTVDDQIWMALLARPGDDLDEVRRQIANRKLSVGVVPALAATGKRLASGLESESSVPRLTFERPKIEDQSEQPIVDSARYEGLEARLVTTGRAVVYEVSLPDVARLDTWRDLPPTDEGAASLPPSLEDDDVRDRVITWLRIRPASGQLDTRFGWLGVNAAPVIQRSDVPAETVGRGSGEPDQTFKLQKTPVFPESVELRVDDRRWTQVDDLHVAPGEADAERAEDAFVFRLDPGRGELTFGDGLHGARPALGATILARYAYGGGEAGNVGIGAIAAGPQVPAGMRVTNPVPTWSGADAESLEAGERRIPSWLKHRDRLVSEEDYEKITNETPGVRMGRVDVLPLYAPTMPGGRLEGAVTVLVIPATDRAHPDAPRPDAAFLEAVCAHLSPKRILTTELYIWGPDYVPIWVSVGIALIPGADRTQVEDAVERQVRAFLSPLTGGFDEAGWPLTRTVDAAELSGVVARVPGVAKVTGLLLAEGTGDNRSTIAMSGLQLPELMRIVARVGDAQPIDDVRGTSAPEGTSSESRRRPVPVVPEGC